MSRSARVALAWLAGDLLMVVASLLSFVLAPESVREHMPNFMQRVFFIDYETNVPTWFATLQFAFVGWLWLNIAQSFRSGSRPDRRLAAGALLICGAAFFGSLDEAAQLHETIGFYTADSLFPRTGYWLFLYLPVIAVVAIAVMALVGRVLLAHRGALAWVVAGAALFVVSAGGVELALNFIVPGGTEELVESHIEETGELLAATMILWGSLQLRDALTGVPQAKSGQ
jgi:hypothetical protein